MMVAGVGTPHIAHRVFIHPKFNASQPLENNVAVVLLRLANDSNPRLTALKPKDLGEVSFGRFCSMIGWEGYRLTFDWIRLSIFPIFLANASSCQPAATQAHCSIQTNLISSFPTCGGLMGSPVFCSTSSVSGILVRDNFCIGSNPVGGSFLSLEDYADWIHEVSAANIEMSMTISLFISLLVSLKNSYR